MIELERTRDPIRVQAMRAILSDAGIESFAFDEAVSQTWPGAFPLRLMVREDDETQARRVLRELGFELSKEK